VKNTIFAFKDDSPKYKQIYEQFKVFIEQGDMLADEQLPSIRQLADSLQVSRNTTLMAYEQLVAEGYIRGEGRKGYFVNENRHIKRMRLVYKRKMQCLVSVLKEQFKQNISIIGEQSGLYLLVKVHLKRSEE